MYLLLGRDHHELQQTGVTMAKTGRTSPANDVPSLLKTTPDVTIRIRLVDSSSKLSRPQKRIITDAEDARVNQ